MGNVRLHEQPSESALGENVFRHVRILSEVALLTYEQFSSHLDRLNALSRSCLDVGGKQLKFAIKKGSDATILWKGTVQVACVKLDPKSGNVESYRLLSLVQFLKVLKSFECQVAIAQQTKSDPISASLLMGTLDEVAGAAREQIATECCICLERKPEVMLPCAHAYCLPCIEQWNVNHKTCPICRETLASTDDTWVLPDVPHTEEMSQEIRSSLMRLAGDPQPLKT